MLRQHQGIIDLYPEVTDGALDLRMFEKQLNRSQITGLAVDFCRLGAAHRVRAIRAAVHPRALDPTANDARVLTRRHVRLIVDSAWKYVGASICWARFQPVFQRGASVIRDLELDRTPVGIDQIVGGIGEEGMPLVRARPLRCRIG